MKARIVAAAAQLRPPQEPTDFGSTPTPYVAPVPSPARAQRCTSGPVPIDVYAKRRPPLLLRPGFLTAVAAALILAFVWWSSRDALPDSPLYNMRIASENIAINFAGSDANQAAGHLNAATSRLYDLREMQERDKLPEAQEAVIDYEKHLSSAEALWQQMLPRPVEVTEQLYALSIAGRATFEALSSAQNTLSAPYRQDIAEAQQSIDLASSEAELELAQAGLDPSAVLARVAASGTDLAALVAPVVSALPTPTGPGVQPSASGSTTNGATPTSVAVLPSTAATPTTAAVVPPATGTPRSETPRATPSPPRATPSPPRATPSPPRATPSPPRATPSAPPPAPATRTQRPVPPTRTATHPPVATSTPVIVQATVCDLSVANVAVVCREQGGVNWIAVVNNRGATSVTASWNAQLEVQSEGGGGFVPVMSVSGNDVFAPGTSNLSRTMQYTFGPTALKARVIVRVDSSGYACTLPAKQSLDVSACNRQNPGGGPPDKTKTPPGLENKPTREPREEPEPPNAPDEKDSSGGPKAKP